jgi:hypothetical protein
MAATPRRRRNQEALMGPHVPRHNKWVRGDDDIAREIIVGGRVRLIRRFAYRGHSEPRWDERFGVIGDIGDVTGAADTFITVRWPNGTDPNFDSTVDRNCVEATLMTASIPVPEDEEPEWQDLGWVDETDGWESDENEPMHNWQDILIEPIEPRIITMPTAWHAADSNPLNDIIEAQLRLRRERGY